MNCGFSVTGAADSDPSSLLLVLLFFMCLAFSFISLFFFLGAEGFGLVGVCLASFFWVDFSVVFSSPFFSAGFFTFLSDFSFVLGFLGSRSRVIK